MKIGLYFGSFNPVHNGHLQIAETILAKSDLKKIWFVVSPQNPLKKKNDLLNQKDRLQMVKLALKGNKNFSASDVEFHLPVPSYTIDTLSFLAKKFPQHTFSVIIGSDNLSKIHLWKNYETLLNDYEIFVYCRGRINKSKWKNYGNIHFPEVDLLKN